MNKTIHAVISGRVQGVGYRAWTAGAAGRLGLTGWVRNRADGTVEALFHGAAQQVDEMMEKLHKGPMLAHVTHVSATPGTDIPEETTFTTRPTV